MNNELFGYIGNSLPDIRKAVKQKYEIAYGSRYYASDIRKAIIDKQPAFVDYNGKSVLVVGENPESLFISDGERIEEVSDIDYNIKTTGDAVIIQDELDAISESRSTYTDTLVILTPEKDEWEGDENREKVRKNTQSIISSLKIGDSWLPECPVIVTFKDPGEKEQREHIKSDVVGVEITLYDSDDPVTEFAHEVGHIFYRDMLTDEERNKFDEYQESISEDDIPAIFTSRWGFSTGEEVFCTIYSWYLKGKLVSPGYLRILQYQEPKGYSMFMDIIDRIEDEKQAEHEWGKVEKAISSYIKNPPLKSVAIAGNNGRKLIKARVAGIKDLPDKIQFPVELVNCEVAAEYKSYTIYKINESILKGMLIPVNREGCIIKEKLDQKALEKAWRNRSHLVKKMVTDRNGISRNVWTNPEEREARYHHGKTVSGAGGGGGDDGDGDEPKPIGENRFGNVYDQFKGKPEEALEFLRKKKSGYCKGVFHRTDIGDIDLAWGSDEKKEGLDHIIEKHVNTYKDFKSPEHAIETIIDVLAKEEIKEKVLIEGKTILKKDKYLVVIREEKDTGNWILSAYDYQTPQRKKKLKKAVTATVSTPGQPAFAEEAGAVASNGFIKTNLMTYIGNVKFKLNKLLKAKSKPIVYLDLDGVTADFEAGYKAHFNRDARNDSPDTVKENVCSIEHFFKDLSVIEKGRELYNQLSEIATVIFLTTPMDGCKYCKSDKKGWVKKNFGNNKVIFSDNKSDYVSGPHSILIDDMNYNLKPFEEAGGVAIDSRLENEEIISKIKTVLGV